MPEQGPFPESKEGQTKSDTKPSERVEGNRPADSTSDALNLLELIRESKIPPVSKSVPGTNESFLKPLAGAPHQYAGMTQLRASSVSSDAKAGLSMAYHSKNTLTDQSGFFDSMGKSFTYSLAQGPIDGVTQIVDNAIDTKLNSSLHFMDAPRPADFGSKSWYGQQIGSAAGMVLPLVLLHKGVTKAMGRPDMSLRWGQLPLATSMRVAASESFVTGSLYGGFLTPTDPSKNLLTERLKSGTATGLTFATLSGTSAFLQGIGGRMAPTSLTGRVLQNPMFTGVAGGLPAGSVSADMHSLLDGKGFAKSSDRIEAMYGFAMIGGLFGAGQRGVDTLLSRRGSGRSVLENEVEGKQQKLVGEKTQTESILAEQPAVVEPARTLGNLKTGNEAKVELGKPEPATVLEPAKVDPAKPVERAEKAKTESVEAVESKGAPPKTDIADVLKNLKVGDTTTRFAGVEPTSTVTRIIDAKGDTKIIMFSGGEKVVHIPGEMTKTEKPGGYVFTEKADGTHTEGRTKSLIPPEERPLNVFSKGNEAIGRELSNFSHRPFEFHGKTYQSVEAFYMGLKWPEAAKRAEIAELHGTEAKRSGRGAPKSETFEFEGKTYKFGSPEHHQLMKDVIRSSIEQSPEIKQQFMETHPRPLEHKTGRPENPNSAFPNSALVRILGELRAEFVEGQKAPMPEARTVSEVLSSIKDPDVHSHFNLDLYSRVFQDFPVKARDLLASGKDSLTLRLEDGNLLKITKRDLTPEMGERGFDVPILERGTRPGIAKDIMWFIQPEGLGPVSRADYQGFISRVRREGYRFIDPGIEQLTYFNGEARLVDPFSVVPAKESK